MILPTSKNDATSLATNKLVKAYREIENRWLEISNQIDEGEENGIGSRASSPVRTVLGLSRLSRDGPGLV